MNEQLFEELKSIIVEKLEIEDPSKITLESRFREDLNADSLDTYELIYAIEEKMNIDIPQEKATELAQVKDALNLIEEQKKKNS